MTTSTGPLRRTTALLLAAAALALGACDDPTEVEGHFEVDGFALFEGTTELYRYMLDDGEAATLTLTQGIRDVAFIPLDAEGRFIPDDHAAGEEEHELLIEIGDATILTWTPEAGEDGVHTFVEFHGELNALQAGSTTLDVCVPHEGHCDFEVTVPVTVTSP